MKALIAALIALPILAACNTIAGVGEDVETVGKVLKDSANEAKD
ncbi:MAG: entericidin [Henriciella sp.]|nr:entericidin [Henriciella sp.]